MSIKLIRDGLDSHLMFAVEEIYPFVSNRQKSIPGAGTACHKTRNLNPNAVHPIERFIKHRNGDITMKCAAGFIRFWKDRSIPKKVLIP